MAVVLVQTPVVPGDTGLWTHLDHGRYIATVGEFPQAASGAFLGSGQDVVFHSWLFQVLAFEIFDTLGYPGLVILRAVAYGSTLACVAFFLFDRRSGGRVSCWALGCWGLYALALIPGFLPVGPQVFSYLWVVLCLVILEKRPRFVGLLPLLGIAWVNLHGIEYPIMVLILGAYLFEYLVLRRRGAEDGEGGSDDHSSDDHSSDHHSVWPLLALTLALWTVLLNPFGADLVTVPFTSTSDAALYVDDLEPVGLDSLFHLDFDRGVLDARSAANILWVLALLACAVSVWKRSVWKLEMRWSHLILLVGGTVLLFRGARFQGESILLLLPWINHWLDHRSPADDTEAVDTTRPASLVWARARRGVALGVFVVVVAMSWTALVPWKTSAFPVAQAMLPTGVTQALQHQLSRHQLSQHQASTDGPLGWRVMHPPEFGGFFRWSLAPVGQDRSVEITMTLVGGRPQPQVFSDEEYFQVTQAFTDPEVLDGFLGAHDPTWIVAPLSTPGFAELIGRHPQYVPVFVDDVSVLYVDREARPGTAAEWALTEFDPFDLAQSTFQGLGAPKRSAIESTLRRLLEVAPGMVSVHQVVARLCILRGEFDEALRHAEIAAGNSPGSLAAHWVLGNALASLGRDREALDSYRRGLRHAADDGERRQVHRAIASTWARLGDDRRALGAMRRAVNPYGAGAADLLALGDLELSNGNAERARQIFRFARWRVPPDAKQWQREIDERMARIP